jgi:hypothetical protein
MLTLSQITAGKVVRRTIPSLRQQYDAYVQQRLEAYKNGLGRQEMLRLGDEAVNEAQSGTADQFYFTEIMMEDLVDRLIAKRLKLPSFTKWKRTSATRREAQRQPIHWGIHPESVLVKLLNRLEPHDEAFAVGGGVQAEVCLLAAYDAHVVFVDQDQVTVDQVEAKLASESLAADLLAYVCDLAGDGWLPDVERPVPLVIVDAVTLAGLPYEKRKRLIDRLKDRTMPEGLNLILPGSGSGTPEAFISHYPDWEREELAGRKGNARRSRGVVLRKPAAVAAGSLEQETA